MIPPPFRRGLLWALLLAAIWIVGLGFAVRHSAHPLPLEGGVDTWLARPSGSAHHVAGLVSDLGDPRVFAILVLVVVVALTVTGDVAAAVVAVVGVSLQLALLELLLKPYFDRHLAGIPGPSYPSGHTSSAFALATAVVLAAGAGRPLGRRLGPGIRHLVMLTSLAIATAIGLAMIVGQAHYLGDVLAGAPLGAGVAAATALLTDMALRRPRPPHPATAAARAA